VLCVWKGEGNVGGNGGCCSVDLPTRGDQGVLERELGQERERKGGENATRYPFPHIT
jgi:hypothetical protein